MAVCNEKIGPQGIRGLQGLKGDTGASGAMGLQGPQGPQGLQGLTGTQGIQGNPGSNGSVGPQGPQGAAGVPGTDGNQGQKGIDGVNGQKGDQGIQGTQGTQGVPGRQGQPGVQGLKGERGTKIIASYVDLIGIGNSIGTGDETLLFTTNITGTELSSDGDQLEIFAHIEYNNNDIVNLIFELDPLNRYIYVVQATNNNIRFIKIKITRVDQNTQVWTIEDITKDTATLIISTVIMDVATTTFNLSNPMTFNIYADNIVLGSNQVVLKGITLYKHNL